MAIRTTIDGDSTYIETNQTGYILINKTPYKNQTIVVTFPDVGVYGRTTTVLHVQPPLGDINRDGLVNIGDVVLVATAYGSKLGDPSWRPEADLSPQRNTIDILDLVTCTKNYGSKW